jgi:hypothetical protein
VVYSGPGLRGRRVHLTRRHERVVPHVRHPGDFGRSGATVYRGALLLGGTVRWLATFTPVATRMALHGESIESTRAHHRRRIGVAINPSSGLSIGDGASEWNRQNAGRTSLDAGG